MKNLAAIALIFGLISCGPKSGDNQDKKNNITQKDSSSSDTSGPGLPDADRKSRTEAFLLKSTTSDETLEAVFYDDEAKVIKATSLNASGPEFYPLGAETVRIYTKEKLEKALIFTCCGNAIKDLKIEKESDEIWKITGFTVNSDSKLPMIFSVNGKDYYLKSPLKKGLEGIREGLRVAVLEAKEELQLSEDETKVLQRKLNVALKKNFGFEMNSLVKKNGGAK